MAGAIAGTVRQFIETHRVGRLATADSSGHPAVVPICYVYDGTVFYSAIDAKPKQVAPERLQRIRNIQRNPHVSLLIDDYSENWNELAYVQIRGTADIIAPDGSMAAEHRRAIDELRLKYAQYRSMSIDQSWVIRILPNRIHAWSADGRLGIRSHVL
jgi:PPOX class probable F420-dependent enzyme